MLRRVQARVIGERGHFDAAAVGQVGDVAVVANVAHEAERLAGGDGLHDPRAILDAAMIDRGGLELQRIDLGVFLGHGLAPLVIRAALAAEGGLVAVEVHRLFVLAEPGHVFAEVAGGFGHEVAEMAEHFAADFFVLVVLGLLEHFAQVGIEIAAFVLEAEEPIHVIDAAAGVGDFGFVLDAAISGDEIERGLHAVAKPDERHVARRVRGRGSWPPSGWRIGA